MRCALSMNIHIIIILLKLTKVHRLIAHHGTMSIRRKKSFSSAEKLKIHSIIVSKSPRSMFNISDNFKDVQ